MNNFFLMYSFAVLFYMISSSFAVDIYPGDNWRTIAGNNPAGTTYIIKAGRHLRQTVDNLQDGDSFIGETGAVMDGDNRTEYAFYAPGVNNVTIKNLEITGYTPREQYAVIECTQWLMGSTCGSGWVIDSCIIHHNDGVGLRFGDNFIVTNNYIHHQLQLGIGGSGTGARIENNEIAFCHYSGTYDDNTLIEEGGAKFVYTTGLVVRGNYVHHNRGPGLWTDINNINTLYEENLVDSNAAYGIFHEISWAATIRCNICRGNGKFHDYNTPVGWGWGSGIMITNSSDVECYNNIVITDPDSGDGIVMLQSVRTDPVGQRYLNDNYVHDNDITYTSNRGCSGMAVDDQSVKGSGNRFDYNHYRVPDPGGEYWLWHSTDDGSWFDNWTTMQSRGQEEHGTCDADDSSPSSMPGCALSVSTHHASLPGTRPQLRIGRYSLPIENITACTVAMYTPSGRLVWSRTFDNLASWGNASALIPRARNGRPISAGMYVVRTTFDKGSVAQQQRIFSGTVAYVP